MQRHRHRVGGLGSAVDPFRKVARSYWPGLFHAATVLDLPRTNKGLEQLLGSQRSHERRATGRKTASPGAVLRGSVRLGAGITTRLQVPSGRDLGRVDHEQWQELRQQLKRGRQVSTSGSSTAHCASVSITPLLSKGKTRDQQIGSSDDRL